MIENIGIRNSMKHLSKEYSAFLKKIKRCNWQNKLLICRINFSSIRQLGRLTSSSMYRSRSLLPLPRWSALLAVLRSHHTPGSRTGATGGRRQPDRQQASRRTRPTATVYKHGGVAAYIGRDDKRSTELEASRERKAVARVVAVMTTG